jgi:hypothetical protein
MAIALIERTKAIARSRERGKNTTSSDYIGLATFLRQLIDYLRFD